MATAGEILTGSTDSPGADGISRGMVVTAVQGLAAFVAILLDITVEQLALLEGSLTLVGFLLYGMFDRFARGQVVRRAAKPPTP